MVKPSAFNACFLTDSLYGYTIYISKLILEVFIMIQTKIFKSNQSQAVRLSKAVAFPEGIKEVEIVVVGNSRIITPANQSWDSWFDDPAVSNDFMIDREQPALQERESFDD